MQGLPTAFVVEVEFGSASFHLHEIEKMEEPQLSAKPTGLLSLILPESLGLRFLIEKLVPALLAGNGVFILSTEANSIPGEILNSALKDLPQLAEGLISIFSGGEELRSLLASHPAFHGVIAAGSISELEKISQLGLSANKKLQLYGGYHNGALLLPETDLDLAVNSLADSIGTGSGWLRQNIHNIYVLESVLPDFEKKLIEVFSARAFAKSEEAEKSWTPMSADRLDKSKAALKAALAENGRVIFQGPATDNALAPTVFKDLSHCSTLQQDLLQAPIVLVSPVKYPHDMVKWTNTSYYGELAQVFGPKEKIQKWGGQLEVGNILGSQWLTRRPLKAGWKQAFYGNPDDRFFGSFFSDVRNFDIDGSKN